MSMKNRGRRVRHGLGTIAGLAAFAAAMVGFMIGSPLAAASAPPNSSAGAKPPLSPGSPVFAPRPQPPAGLHSGLGSSPSPGQAPATNGSQISRRVVGGGKRAAVHKPAPALLPKTGTVLRSTAPSPVNQSRAEINGHVHLGPSHKGAGPLLTAAPSSTHPAKAKGFTPSTFYSSTQLDKFSAECGFGVNETTIAQSTDNPSLLVAGANTYYDNSGNCQDSHAGVYHSSDGGQHWSFEVMPGLQFPASGDPEVTYDPVRHMFLYAFVEFTRNDDTKGRIGVEASSDGVNWSRNTTLDSSNASDGTDKPTIAVDQNPASPHYGRIAVAWTEFFGNNAVYQEDYTDTGGSSWVTGDASVNQTSHECGNGASAAFNANGELMVAWADCSGGTNSIYSELSTDGGRTWSTGVDHQITTTNPIEGAEQNTEANCLLNAGGTDFRCNSFPSLAGDPNAGDAGGQAFFIVWANVDSTTQNSQTANVSQLHGLSTVNDGTNWNNGSFSFAFMASDNFGDKFFPAASFSPNGRLTVSFSDREDDASSGNPNGLRFDEHQSEASSLTNLRNASYVVYTTDGTLGDPGGLTFIGDYAGNTSLDRNFDTFPVWTDLRNGFPSARTQDLCYADCMTSLSPGATFSASRTGGSTFTDFYSFSMDPSTGSGNNFWNVVGLRPGTDGTSVDDDMSLAPNRYYDTSLASSAQSPPRNDYVVVNGNSGHAPDTVYFPSVHSFGSFGGSYSLQWEAGHITLGTSLADSMAGSDVARVYDSFLSAGTTYFFGLRPNSGNTSNYSLALHSASKNSEQGRSTAVADSGNVVPGAPAFVQYNTAPDPAQFDGLVALNNNSGSGSYTLYRDTVVPDGTIKINGGAASTNNVTLNLALSSDNATAGDPVMDMAFSVNGGPFGTFRKFVTSTTINVPSGDGKKTVSVEYRNAAGGVSAPVSASIYLVQHAPTVTSLSPTGGSSAGGNIVTINGTNLAPGAAVKFGTTASSSVSFVSATQLKAKAPAHALGIVHVTVTTPGGTSTATNADRYAYAAPTVTSVSPNAGSTAGGNTVTIGGTNFVAGMTVRFAATTSTAVTFVSATQVKAKAPARAAGTVNVSVTTTAGTSPVSNADLYAYGAPTVSSLSPLAGSTAGGSTVTINGSGFVPGATVKFGTTASSSVTFVSGTQIKAKAPAHAAGVINVRVTTPAGTSAAASANRYTYGPPTVTSLSPNTGPTGGGNTVTINGSGFVPGATVKFGTTASSSVTFVSGTQIKAKAPAHAAGAVNVRVTTPAGMSAASSANRYTY
jgi:hypothetical protein